MAKWFIYNKKADFYDIAARFGISPFLARIIRNRDITADKDIDEYLNGGVGQMHDPFLMDGAGEACDIIFKTIRAGKKIRIVGDYDIDGVCASYILKTFLRFAGADADVAIPDRVEDGYGINPLMVEKAAADGTSLIITCDNGIRAFEAVEKARELGIKMIVTDHHEPDTELPAADVVIDPHIAGSHYPYPDLCGASVAYKLMQALNVFLFDHKNQSVKTESHTEPSDYSGEDFSNSISDKYIEGEKILDELLMFAGFATVGDVVPLKGENRIIAKEGITRLRSCNNIGMNALIDVKALAKDGLDAYHIGFVLGPCVNSAGRLQDASLALELFESTEETRAFELAQELSTLNEERKELTESNFLTARNYFYDLFGKQGKDPKVLAVYLKDAHESIAGIIAGRLRELFYRPSFVITDSAKGLKGSGRSIEAYNMIGEISKFPELFEKFGGHPMACGFTLKPGMFHEFSARLNEECGLSDDDLEEKIWIDMQLPVKYVSEELVYELERVKPFGAGNKKPLFADKGLKVNRYIVMGKNSNALKIFFESEDGTKIEGIMFGSSASIAERSAQLESFKNEYGEAFRLAVLYYPQLNEFRDMRTLQLNITDFDISR